MIEDFEALTDEQAGRLIKTVLSYVNDQNPTIEDQVIKLAFISIKKTLKRDLDEWKKTCKRNSENGKKGGRPAKTEGLIEKPKKPTAFFENPIEPKKADKDKDRDIDNSNNNTNTDFLSFSDLLLEFESEKPMKRPYLVRMAEIHSMTLKQVLDQFRIWATKNEGKQMTISHAENSFNLFLKQNPIKSESKQDTPIILQMNNRRLQNPQ